MDNILNVNLENFVPLALVSLVLLLFVILVIQQIRIRKLSKPKYGFLGKPLSIIVLAGFGLMTIGLGSNLLLQRDQIGDISVDQIIKDDNNYLLIEYFKINNNLYRFKSTPIINKIPWGEMEVRLDFEWEFITERINNTILDYNVSVNNNNGVIFRLNTGVTKVKVSTLFNNLILEGEINVKL